MPVEPLTDRLEPCITSSVRLLTGPTALIFELSSR